MVHANRTYDSQTPPSFAWVAVTNKCNLNCDHCQRRQLKKQGLLKTKEMSANVFGRLEREVIPSLKRIQFGGNNFGEPLSAAMWDGIFLRVRQFNVPISLVTNGSLLTAERMTAMIEAAVEFNFSLEGITKTTYEAVRGCNFENFFATVAEACRRKAGTASRVNLGFTALRDNVTEIPQLLATAASLGVDRVTITHFVPWEESQRMKSLVYHREITNDVFAKARDLAEAYALLVDLPLPFSTDPLQANERLTKTQHPTSLAPCYHPWNSVSINEAGDVMPCCASSVIMGNLEKSTFSEIWNNRKYHKLRETVNSPRPLQFCLYCGLRGIEVGGTKPLSFCSDETLLLATIGSDRGPASSRQMLRSIKNTLSKTSIGKTLIPFLRSIYLRKGAFFRI